MEKVAAVWFYEHFHKDVYGTNFQIFSEQKTSSSVREKNLEKRTSCIRLTRLEVRLVPFQFDIVHSTGRTLRFTKNLFLHIWIFQDEAIKTEELWNSRFTVNPVNAFRSILENKINQAIRCKRNNRTWRTACLPGINNHTLKSRARWIIDFSSVNKMPGNYCKSFWSIEKSRHRD